MILFIMLNVDETNNSLEKLRFFFTMACSVKCVYKLWKPMWIIVVVRNSHIGEIPFGFGQLIFQI